MSESSTTAETYRRLVDEVKANSTPGHFSRDTHALRRRRIDLIRPAVEVGLVHDVRAAFSPADWREFTALKRHGYVALDDTKRVTITEKGAWALEALGL